MRLDIVRRCIFVFHVLIIMSGAFVLLTPGCQNPHDFEPPEDSLSPAPDPPVPLAPDNGYVYMFQEPPFSITTIFEWTPLEDAEFYEIEYTVDTFPPVTITNETHVCTLFTKDTTSRRCKHYWRVRASSPVWEWFTEWSGSRWFEMRQQPFGPPLQYPPDNAVFLTDTFPFIVEIQWDTIFDEEYYEILVYKDSTLFEQSLVNANDYLLYITDHAWFSWQVRAGSLNWQYYSLWSEPWHFGVNPLD